MDDTVENTGSVISGILWMFFISILLFWLPLIGPLIAGVVGGKKSGGIGAALLAVFLPGIFFAIALFALASSLTGVAIIGSIAAMGGFALSMIHIGPLLLGAIVGGALA